MNRRVSLPLALPAALGVVLLGLPVLGLLIRAPWRRVGSVVRDATTLEALRLSMVCSLGALAVALVVGVPLAWLLARVQFRLKSLVRAVVMLPLVLPPVVGGVALLYAVGRFGLLGGALAAVGVHLPFTTAGAVLAEAFVALPFLVLTLEGALASLDRRHEEVATTLGAGQLGVFLRVSLPLVAPALAAGAALTWARALGEFGATVTFAGDLPGRTETLPLAVYARLGDDPDAAAALSLVLLVVSVAVLVALRGRWLPRR